MNKDSTRLEGKGRRRCHFLAGTCAARTAATSTDGVTVLATSHHLTHNGTHTEKRRNEKTKERTVQSNSTEQQRRKNMQKDLIIIIIQKQEKSDNEKEGERDARSFAGQHNNNNLFYTILIFRLCLSLVRSFVNVSSNGRARVSCYAVPCRVTWSKRTNARTHARTR